MIICICNNITDNDLKRDASLINLVGTRCGQCKIDPMKMHITNQWLKNKIETDPLENCEAGIPVGQLNITLAGEGVGKSIMNNYFPQGTQRVIPNMVLSNHICNTCEAPRNVEFRLDNGECLGYCMVCDNVALRPADTRPLEDDRK